MLRRPYGRLAAASALLCAVGAPVAGLSPVHATTTSTCVRLGSATIYPGLQAVPAAESWSLAGFDKPCVGGLAPGGFVGSANCPTGNLATCAPFATLSMNSSVMGVCSGQLVQQGPLLQTACTGVGGSTVAVGVMTTNSGPTDWNAVSFEMVATMVQP